MKVAERLEREEDNLNNIILYSDGGEFVRAYNHSAYAFTTRIKDYVVLASLNQARNEVYVHIGFPLNIMDGMLKNYSTEILGDKIKAYTVTLDEPIDLNRYEAWKERKIVESEKHKIEKKKKEIKNNSTTDKADDTAQRAQETACPDVQDVIDDMLAKNVLTMTPLEALSFLADIQTQLRVMPKKEKRGNLPFEQD